MKTDRLLLVVVVISGFFIILVSRLFSVQVVNGEEYRFYAQRQHTTTQTLIAQRGLIYDRNMTLLAYNSQDVSFYIDPQITNEKGRDTIIANTFAKVLGKDVSYFKEKMNSESRNVCIAKKVPLTKADALKNINVYGVFPKEDPTRVYPYKNLASHILGYSNSEFTGVEGLESHYDKELKGIDGRQVILKDAVGGMISINDDATEPAIPGNNLILTIDKEIQKILEDELTAGLKRSGGKYAVGIIMDPNTGGIIAITNKKDYDPNQYGKYDNYTRRNKAITDMYEPGSTFKTFAMASFLDDNTCALTDNVNVENGRYNVNKYVIRDSHPEDVLTVKEVFAFSSNIGMAKLSQNIDNEKFFVYLRSFGFGNYSNIELPGEIKGILPRPSGWSAYTKMSLSYGYHVGVTPLQLINAFSAVINGGILYEPQLVKRIELPDGTIKKDFEPKEIRRVIDEETSEKMRELLREAVSNGTGWKANIKEISVGGKTGTSKQWVDGEYSESYYNSSFIGFVPVDNPKYACLIMVHSPDSRNYYGGDVAAPIFKNVFERVIERNPELKDHLIDDGNDFVAPPIEFKYAAHDPAALLPTGDTTKMPDLRGLTMREAALVMHELQIPYDISGSGIIIEQDIHPGTKLSAEMHCKLKGKEISELKEVLH